MRRPLISIIIPVYNGDTFIQQAINNVLAQHLLNAELIIVDDGSSDNTAQIINSNASVIYIYQPHSGVSSARNTGLKHAKGEYIAFIDCDDVWNENAISKMLEVLNTSAEVEIVEGLIQKVTWDKSKLTFINHNSPYYCPAIGNTIFRKSVFDKIGVFDERLNCAEDIDFYTRAWENNIVKCKVDFVVLFYRISPENLKDYGNQIIHNRLLVFKFKLERQRNTANFKPSLVSFLDYMGNSKIE